MASQATIDRVRRVIRDSLRLGPDAAIDEGMALVGGEYDLDSLDILLVVTNIEKEFGIKIEDKKVGRDMFSSVRSLAEFVETHGR